MAQKIRVGAASYLNTKPLIYGFEQGLMNDQVELTIDYPSRIAQQLLDDEIDIGLVPVAVIPKLKEHHIISDYGIGCDGEVASVCLFSEVPIEEIKTIYLDYQSRTSVELLKILLKEYWKLSPELVNAHPGFEQLINGTTAALVIGDRALKVYSKYPYRYDLGAGWKALTGLPFVFAAWVSNKAMDAAFINAFNEATTAGFSNISNILAGLKFPEFDLEQYYKRYIQFHLSAESKNGLNLFLSFLTEIKPVSLQ